jgi:hypothetical protein
LEPLDSERKDFETMKISPAISEFQGGEKTPIRRYGGKDSEAYRYFANDFLPIRKRNGLSIWFQAAPIIMAPDVHSVLEFGGGRDVFRS